MEFLLPLLTMFAPMVSGLSIWFFGREWGERSARVGIVALWCAALSAVATFVLVLAKGPMALTLIGEPSGPLSYTIVVDRLSSVMLMLISLVSLIIHVYSERYMVGDQGYARFFALVGSLTSVLLGLVTSGNVLWMFLYWHGVTWLLATLVAFQVGNRAAVSAGRRTFWVQSLGDVAFGLALVMLYHAYGTLDLTGLSERLRTAPAQLLAGAWQMEVPAVATLLLILSVMTKSAQFPLHVWLIGTLEAPTPVSALMHAGIVNAGGFLVNRLAPLFGQAPTTLHLLFVIGAVTALIGAAAMLTQPSVKRMLVYSTMGQMGYMVMECGLGAFALAVFHLCAHGLFKATLFLNSGANIHKARVEFKLPSGMKRAAPQPFSAMTWTTGLAVTLVLPLVILLALHGVVQIPLQDGQGAVIFLFFGWVTASQAMFSLYRMQAGASWKVSVTMLAALALIGLTYLWAGEAFTHFLYPGPGEAMGYLQAAQWNRSLFDLFVGCSAVLVLAAWGVIYGEAKGLPFLMPTWMEPVRAWAYVAFLNGLYVEDFMRAVRRKLFGRVGQARGVDAQGVGG
ncbi:MAG: NADH-quinone oxidoreductase subunit L [Nitrospiraceae bacterium]|nr:NADH-quinone oxidoreductase subunit L [Nitrospiraceae bacterium]